MINRVRKRIDGPNRGYNVVVYPLGDDGRWIVGLLLSSLPRLKIGTPLGKRVVRDNKAGMTQVTVKSAIPTFSLSPPT